METTILSRVLQSFLIWIATNLFASILVGTTLTDEFLLILVISLAFSSPCLLLLPFVIYWIDKIEGQFSRIAFGVASIIILSVITISLFSLMAGPSLTQDRDVILSLSSYILFALISFFTIHEIASHRSAKKSTIV